MDRATRRRPIVPAFWADFYEQTHIPAAIQAGGQLRLTGHTGTVADGSFPDDVEAQIRQTFLNIHVTLNEAGASWGDVVELTSYHVGLGEQSDALLRVAADFLDDPYPAWTAVGVTALFETGAVIEISCVAVVDD